MRVFFTTCSCLFFCFFTVTFARAIPEWTFHGKVAEGGQFDALAGPDGKVHLISSAYYQFDIDGRRLLIENKGDEKQSGMSFPPSLAIDSLGNVHMITRHGGSDASTGFEIRYRKRNTAGEWLEDFVVGSRQARNYVVGIAAPGIDSVYMHSTKAGDNVWGDVRIWKKNDFPADNIGDLGGIWRADTDARMRGFDGKIFLVSGKCDGNGAAYFTFCNAGANCFNELSENIEVHSSGNFRKGAPDLYVDKKGNVHMTYGTQFEVYYNQYNSEQKTVFSEDRKLFSGLGSWHLQLGLSAIAATDDGDVVVAVALDPDGSKGGGNSELIWVYSTDSGASWSMPERLGVYTDAGEGRRRPRLVAVEDTFMLFFQDNAVGGISLATIELDRTGGVLPIMAPVHHLLLK